jgi:hypothetical protein
MILRAREHDTRRRFYQFRLSCRPRPSCKLTERLPQHGPIIRPRNAHKYSAFRLYPLLRSADYLPIYFKTQDYPKRVQGWILMDA